MGSSEGGYLGPQGLATPSADRGNSQDVGIFHCCDHTKRGRRHHGADAAVPFAKCNNSVIGAARALVAHGVSSLLTKLQTQLAKILFLNTRKEKKPVSSHLRAIHISVSSSEGNRKPG